MSKLYTYFINQFNKHMKKLLLFVLSLLFVTSSAFAGEYTLTFKDTGTANDGSGAFSATKGVADVVEESNYVTSIKEVSNVYTGKQGFGLKFSSSKVNGSITFNLSTDGAKKISKVVATACKWKSSEPATISINDAEAQDLTDELADYTFEFTPTENNTTIKIAATKRMYVSKLVVTYLEDGEAAGPAMPAIKMAANNMVEMSAADGAKIYYTLTGEDPTVDNGTLYDGAFQINAAVQVKAIAVVDGKSSSVANFAAYINTVTSIDALLELNDLTHTLTLEAPLTIVYHNGRNMYVNQDNAFLLLYGVNSDKTYANGDQLASVTGIYTLYRDVIPELKDAQLGEVTEGGTPVEATAMTIADINALGAEPTLMNYFVKIEGVTIDLATTKLIQDGNELTYYNQAALTLPEATEGKTYNVEGFISYYNNNIQVNIINVTEVEEPAGEYETYPADRTINRTDGRHTASVTMVADGKTQTISNLQSSTEKHIYRDATAQVAEFAPGATVNVTAAYNGFWMHGYLWIDYNKDYQFVAELDGDDIPTATSELVGFSNYNSNPDNGGTWHSSNGITYENGGQGLPTAGFSFVIPENLPAGEYRARYIVDYNILEPVPSSDRTSANNWLEGNGGMVADFTIRIVEPTKYTVTIAPAEHGTIKVLNGETEIASGAQVNEGTVITIAGEAERGYILGSATANGAPIDGFTYEVNEDVEIGGTFVERTPSYTEPTGETYPNNYLTAITSTGAEENISYTADANPGLYNLLTDAISVVPGSEFSINFVANGNGQTTAQEDIRYCAAYIFADWDGYGDFDLVAKVGNTPPTDNSYGNYDDVMNINQTFTMPADVTPGTATRIRIIYHNAWTPLGTSSLTDAPNPNATNINKGIAYDIIVNAVAPAPTTYAITIADTENGSIKVMNGEEEITSGTEVEEGTTLTVVATPAENYSLEAITLNDAALAAGEDGSYSFIVDEAYTVAATFAINKYAVTITEPQNGTLVVMNGEETVATGTELAHGTELSIIATPAEGYELGAITVNGNAIEGNTLTLTEAATIAATFNEAGPEYETYPADRNSSHNARYTSAIVLTANGESQTISDLQTGTGQAIYQDATAQSATFEAGTEVSVRANYNGEWMHGYLWIDYNKDGVFTPELNDEVLPTATSELVGFTSYNDETGSLGWHDSNGNNYSDGAHNPNNPFTFVLPADLPAGNYRARYIVDWNSLEPLPSSDRSENTLEGNGGIVADFTITIPVSYCAVTIAETEATVEANVEDLTAVEKGTDVTFTVTVPEGKQLVSVAYNDEIITVNEDGTYTVTVNADGTLTVTLQNIPEPGKALLVPSANGSNIYTFRIDDAVLGSHTNGTVDENDLRSHNLTYSAWINIKNTTSGPIMGNIQSQFIDATGAFVVKLKDGKLTLEGRGNKSDTGYDNENPAASESTDPGTANDEWVFVSVVADREAKTVTLYKNCKAIASYNVENKLGLLPDESSFFIGGNGTSVEFTEVQLWNKALTPDELMDTYNFHYTETPENLAAYYKPSEFVEGSTTDLRNLGTVGTDVPGQLLMGTSSYSSAQWTYIYTGTPQEIVPIDEDRVLGTAAITLVQPVSEGNSLRLVNANGQAVGSEVTLFEKINVVPTLAEGIEVLGVVVESEGQTTTYSLDQFPIRATGDMTISLKLNDLYKVVATAENATVSVAVNDGEATELPAEGLEVAKGSKVVVTFTPAEGMVFKSFTVNGEDAELTENAYTIDAIDADYTLAAAYKEFTYKLTIINPADSDVPENNVYGEFYNNMMERYDYDDAEGLEVAPGTRVYLYISPAENHGSDEYYYFNGLTDNDQEVSVSEVMSSGNNAYLYPLNAIDADHTIVIKQALYTGIVGVVADAEGMISFSDYTIRVAADNAQIDIFDLNGRTLRSVAANEITVSDLVKGVYFAKATVNGKVYTLKFIKL